MDLCYLVSLFSVGRRCIRVRLVWLETVRQFWRAYLHLSCSNSDPAFLGWKWRNIVRIMLFKFFRSLLLICLHSLYIWQLSHRYKQQFFIRLEEFLFFLSVHREMRTWCGRHMIIRLASYIYIPWKVTNVISIVIFSHILSQFRSIDSDSLPLILDRWWEHFPEMSFKALNFANRPRWPLRFLFDFSYRWRPIWSRLDLSIHKLHGFLNILHIWYHSILWVL